jgi:hypothetical protein
MITTRTVPALHAHYRRAAPVQRRHFRTLPTPWAAHPHVMAGSGAKGLLQDVHGPGYHKYSDN